VGEKDVEAVETFAKEFENSDFKLMPWDWNYYSEKLKDSKFSVNDEMTRPYFKLENVKKGIFDLAGALYGISFKRNDNIQKYHPEVETYEVYDKDGSFLSILYMDFFPRDGKQSGAWMNTVKEQYTDEQGQDSRPQIIIVTNFSRPTETKPSLLTYDESNTFLHEFGHALHGMMARGKYASLSGTNVYRDFVELPSQIMENWLAEKEFLDKIAVHYKDKSPIPSEMVKSLIDAANFNAGYACCRQLSFGLLDMAWHTIEKPFDGSPEEFEKKAWKEVQLMPEIQGTLMSTNFSHIFSGGYAAGYYGYKWAEVLDADAFDEFKRNGIFDRKTAEAFRHEILEKGGTVNPDKLYLAFKGRKPTIDALLRRNGVLPE
jgi:peptidyl-dipeptidase Dcp